MSFETKLPLNQIICGDCVTVMETFPKDSIDLIVTSPPYDSLRAYHGYDFDYKLVADQLLRIIKVGGVVVWVIGDATVNGSETGTSFKQALYFKAIGFNLHDTMIYLKNQMAYPDFNRYYNAFEYMFVFSKGKPKTFNLMKDRENVSVGRKVNSTERRKDGTTKEKHCVGNIIPESGVRWNYWLIYNQSRGIWNQHPATFPLQLAQDHIISWSNEGDIVLQPVVEFIDVYGLIL